MESSPSSSCGGLGASHERLRKLRAKGDKPYAIALTAIWNVALVLSYLAPIIHEPHENYIDIYSTLASLINSSAWLLYATAMLNRDRTLVLLITNGICFFSSSACLLKVYLYHSKSKIKVMLLFIFMTVILTTMITLFQLELEKTKALGNIFGVGGVVAIVLGFIVQTVNQMFKGIRNVDGRALLFSVLPNLAASVWSLVDTGLYHREHIYILVSSILRCVFQLVDLLCLIWKNHKAIADWLSHIINRIIREKKIRPLRKDEENGCIENKIARTERVQRFKLPQSVHDNRVAQFVVVCNSRIARFPACALSILSRRWPAGGRSGAILRRGRVGDAGDGNEVQAVKEQIAITTISVGPVKHISDGNLPVHIDVDPQPPLQMD